LSSEIYGPNNGRALNATQQTFHSFYIDDAKTIAKLKNGWVFESSNIDQNFVPDYYLTYCENGQYRGKINLDLQEGKAVSGEGISLFNPDSLTKYKNAFKPLKTKFLSFTYRDDAIRFYKAISINNWFLPSPDDNEFYIWTQYKGECIVQINNKTFAREKDIEKALDAYLPKKFKNKDIHYKLFKFTNENSTVRICSQENLTAEFPDDFKVVLPFTPFENIVIPLINHDEQVLDIILTAMGSDTYRVLDKIE
ncbi:MAG: hypothetical protein JXR60_06555, partial [Bacteroidales bacterium]|nr:hypothetical protein [Bacteroidales bacterium]